MIVLFSRTDEVASRIESLVGSDVLRVETGQQLLRGAQDGQHLTAVIIAEDIELTEATAVADQLRTSSPLAATILLRSRVDLAITTQAMRSGIRAVLPSTDLSGLLDQVLQHEVIAEAIEARIQGTSDQTRRGRVVIVYSAKGGVGKTTTSLNLAAVLSYKTGERVVVVDLDLQFGDVAVATGRTKDVPRITALGTDPNVINVDTVGEVIVTVAENFDVVLAPETPAEAERVTAPIVTRAIDALSHLYDWVVIDGPPAFTDEILGAFGLADVQVLVSTPDLASLKNLALASQTLRKIGLDKTPRCVIINRLDTRARIDMFALRRAARRVSESRNLFVVRDYPLILQSASVGEVASLGASGRKVRKLYRDIAEFVRRSSEVAGTS
jgi:pilus assembly protein CpaE